MGYTASTPHNFKLILALQVHNPFEDLTMQRVDALSGCRYAGPMELSETIDMQAVAFDVALGYDEPSAIAYKHGITEQTLAAVQYNPVFKDAVRVAEREITETGKEFKLKARKLSSLVLDQLARIALDDEASHSDRIKAIGELTRLAGYQAPDQASAGSGFQVNIQLNNTH